MPVGDGGGAREPRVGPARVLSPRVVVVVLVVVVVSAVAVIYTHDPRGVGDILFSTVGLACLITCLVGPWARGVYSVSTRVLPGSACFCFVLAVVVRPWKLVVAGPVQAADVLSVLGFVLLVAWTSGLSRRYYPQNRLDYWVDTLLVITGSGLVLWSFAIAPSLAVGEVEYPRVLSAFYCAWDVVVIGLATQLLYRAGVLVMSMAWCLLALGGLLVTDVGFVWLSASAVSDEAVSSPALTSVYLLSFTAFALGLSHPSVRLLDSPAEVASAAGPANGRHSGLFVFFMTPSLACLLYPATGAVDTVARGVLLAAILVLVHIRLRQGLTALAASEQLNRDRSLRDPLTHLGNRTSLGESLPRIAAAAATRGDTYGVCLLDFDGFKRINDTWGHAVGDDFLCAIADRLREAAPWADTVVRLGGDEFLVAVTATDMVGVVERADDVHTAFLTVLTTPSTAAVVTPSIGVATAHPGELSEAGELIRRADVALYAAKRAGRSRVVAYTGDVARGDETRRRLRADFVGALRDGGIGMDFQPIVTNSSSARVVGWEALARWAHPVEGDVPPEVFVPLAEEYGLVDELTWVGGEQACRFLDRREALGAAPDEWVALNVGPRQLAGDAFGERFVERVRACGGQADRLRIEVTEDEALSHDDNASRSLATLRAAGVRVVIDDFGSGFAGIGLVRRIGVDGVKIDRGFVARATDDAQGVQALRAVVALLRGLSVPEVTVTGVESDDDARLTGSLAADLVQGRFYGGAERVARSVSMTEIESVGR